MKTNLPIAIAIFAITLVTAISVRAQASPDSSTFEEPQTAFCGINSLYTALQILGFDTDLRSLLSRKYISAADGSTYADLIQAAKDQHACAEVFGNLSYDELTAIHAPCILHVRPEYDSLAFSHFVLVVSQPRGRLILYDAPRAPRPVSGAELVALWDGSAMIVATSPAALPQLSRTLRWPFKLGAVAAAAFTVLFLIRSYLPESSLRVDGLARLPIQVAVLIGVAVCLSAIFHRFSDSGFLRQLDVVQMIAKSSFVSPARKVDVVQFSNRVGDGATIIDARFPADYSEDHVKGALNVPPDTSFADRAKLLEGIDRGSAIVVYCAGPACPYASILANRLTRDGFESVEVFPGGWAEWNRASTQPTVTIAVSK